MTEEVFEAAPAETGPQLPGRMLREAREARGLTVAEVAASIKFHHRQIEALESDDYGQLQGKTFLRGFVRAYARMLQMPADPLLDMLEHANVFHEEVVAPPDNMGETNPTPFYLRHAKGLMAVVVVLLVAAGFGWTAFNVDLQGLTQKPATIVAENPPATAAHEVAMNPVAIPDGSTQQAADAMSGAESLSGTAAQATPDAVALSATAAPAVPANMLDFEFSGLSWLEVKDGSGRILITGEFPAGQKQGVNGRPPFELWIGKASAVKVMYKSQPVDVMPHAHDDVARLTLN